MSDEWALRQAVLAAPNDDLPRLVYADWLDDAGDPTRAEFIRTQMELDRLAPWDPARVRAKYQSPQWLAGTPWRDRLPALGSGAMADWATCPFRRGFGWCVHVRQLSAFLQMAPEIVAVEPIGELILPAGTRDDWAEFAKSSWLAQIQRLRFTTGSGLSEPIRALIHSEYSHAIDSISFEVSTSPGMSAVVESLVQSPLAKQLKHLEFRLGHDRDGDILQELVNAPALQLESLFLSTMGQTAEALQYLARLPHADQLKSLVIQNQTATGAVADAIAATLDIFPLRQFALLAGQLTGTDLLSLARRTTQQTLRSIDLSQNRFDDTALLAALQEPGLDALQVLHLCDCGLDDACIPALFAASCWSRLVELDLSGNHFTAEGLEDFLNLPLPENLVALVLRRQDIPGETRTRLRHHFGDRLVTDV